MKNPFANLTWTQKAAGITLLLGVGALFLGNPYKGERVTMNMQDLALMVQDKSDHVTVQELADWLIQGKADFRLIDVRSTEEYNEYHIPNAENISITDLTTADIQRNEKIIIYSEGGIHAAQAWMMLVARGFKKSYILFGGLEEWKSAILFPQFPENPLATQVDSLAKVKAICAHFGGSVQSQSAGSEMAASTPTPKLKLPTSTSAAPKAAGKKKKEGC